jgi:nicotinate-nucleotide adenylyltransferase
LSFVTSVTLMGVVGGHTSTGSTGTQNRTGQRRTDTNRYMSCPDLSAVPLPIYTHGVSTAPRLGLFGGTFDPPHIGHLVTAVNVRAELDLDRVLLVVAGEPWQKVGSRPLSPAADRLAMVEAAVSETDGVEASPLEIDRGGPSFTADTIDALDELDPTADLFIVLGRDAAAGVMSWDRTDRLRRGVTLVVVDRPGAEALELPADFSWLRVEVPMLDVSSTDLRARVRDGRPLDWLLPEPVIACIADRQLYRDPHDG